MAKESSIPAVNRKELAQGIAAQFKLSGKDSEAVVDGVFGALAGALKGGREVRIPSIGSFAVADVPARTGRNPKTGEPMNVAASKKIRFKASKQFKESAGLE